MSVSHANASQPRVFVVDDDDAVRAAVSLLVRSYGWDAVPCADAEDFLARYAPEAHQCLVLDLCMPGMSGLELQRELGRRGDTVPIIVVTAHHDRPEANLMVQRGAHTVLGKPFDHQDLVDWIRRLLDTPT